MKLTTGVADDGTDAPTAASNAVKIRAPRKFGHLRPDGSPPNSVRIETETGHLVSGTATVFDPDMSLVVRFVRDSPETVMGDYRF